MPANHRPPELFYATSGIGSQHGPTLRIGLINNGEYFVFLYADGVRFFVNRPGTEVWADWPDGYHLEDACTYLYGPVLGFVLRLRGDICLHASAVCVGDAAIALVGRAGAGKSTVAAGFAGSLFPVLSDDVLALKESRSQFLVQPGYPRVNLWPDSAGSLFGSQRELPRITPTWEKRYLALDQSPYDFQPDSLPLRAVYILDTRGPDTAPVIRDLGGSEALMALVANSYVNYLLDREMRTREFDVLGRLVASVPVRRVVPQDDPSAIFRLCDAIAADALQFPVPQASVPLARPA